jgi:hypothetical protein
MRVLRTGLKLATLRPKIYTPPPGGGPLWRGNEPAGMTQITERAFDAKLEDGWYFDGGDGTPLTILSDVAAPKSPPGVIQLLYANGMESGVAPMTQEADWTAGLYKTIYVCYYIKVSPNWWGQIVGVVKTIHFWVGDGSISGNKLYTLIEGTQNGPLSARVNLQGIVAGGNEDSGTSAEFPPNIGGQPATIVRGQWHMVEGVWVANTSGNADGSVDWWLDGIHVGSYSGIQFVPGAATFFTLKWSPTWGGGAGDFVPADQYQYFDHFYLSGKP